MTLNEPKASEVYKIIQRLLNFWNIIQNRSEAKDVDLTVESLKCMIMDIEPLHKILTEKLSKLQRIEEIVE